MFKSKFEALRLRRGHKRAIFAIAHKILETVFLLIRRQTHYWDSSVDLEALSLARGERTSLVEDAQEKKQGVVPVA